MSPAFSYSIAVFMIIIVAGCAVNLLEQHYIFQLIGIAFFFTYMIINSSIYVDSRADVTIRELFYRSMPCMFGISACLVSLALGFWIFPSIRNKFSD
jgi:hypothetical protein